MKKRAYLSFLCLLPVFLAGCGPIGHKAASISIVYGAAAILSLLLLIGYCLIAQKKEVWFLLLFTSVLVVNIGYFTLSISSNLEEALLANRIAYLGSVFLPMSMLMIILNVTGSRPRRWLWTLLLGIGILVFLVAASPGYLDIYYKEVAFRTANGVSYLEKTYAPWHRLYLFYLLGYSVVTVAAVVQAAVKRKMGAASHAVILAIAVLVNIGVWLIEQLVRIDFEILSLSYIISELFLLGLNQLLTENSRLHALVSQQTAAEAQPIPEPLPEPAPAADDAAEPPAREAPQAGHPQAAPEADRERFSASLASLTKTERAIYDRYLAGKTTKEIMAELNIKENTLKFHNKNLYGKFGVSSRKQLLELHRSLRDESVF